MAIRDILQLGNELLYQPSLPLDDPGSETCATVAHDLRETLTAFRDSHDFGQGIAAPQIGILQRIIYVQTGLGGLNGALINPRYEWFSEERRDIWDACFSFPDLLVRVKRHEKIRIGYRDEKGARQTLSAQGILAELLQHEIDHLDGVLAVQRAISPRAFITRAEWERRGGP